MNFIKKYILKTIFLFIFSVAFSQTAKIDSLRGDFTYLLQYKPISNNKDYVVKELFSLQISDKRAFFISENRLKFDSFFIAQFNKNKKIIDLKTAPKSSANFLIIQKYEHIEYYEHVAMTTLSYIRPIINNWKLINETKIINSLECKKAEVRYKGRDWIAWYCPKIPFFYGPNMFSGLPGLIVKITDKTGDYDFELVKSIPSSNLKGKVVSVNKYNYENAKVVTKKELIQARDNARENARQELENMGTMFSQDKAEYLRDREKRKELEKKQRNPLELED